MTLAVSSRVVNPQAGAVDSAAALERRVARRGAATSLTVPDPGSAPAPRIPDPGTDPPPQACGRSGRNILSEHRFRALPAPPSRVCRPARLCRVVRLAAARAPGATGRRVRDRSERSCWPSVIGWASINHSPNSTSPGSPASLRLDFGESLQIPTARRRADSRARGQHGAARFLGAGARDGRSASRSAFSRAATTRRRARAATARVASMVVLSMPSLVTSLLLLLVAARTGWFPAGGLPGSARGSGAFESAFTVARSSRACHRSLSRCRLRPSLERLQSRAIREALDDPSIVAALARGIPRRRVVWRHALRLVAQTGARDLRHHHRLGAERIVRGRDRHVLAGPWRPDVRGAARRATCISSPAAPRQEPACLALGILVSDLALVAVDPRLEEPA